MSPVLLNGRLTRRSLAAIVSLLFVLFVTAVAFANVAVTQIGTDPYTNTTSQHRTQVEPDTFAFGSTIVAAAQTGRFNDGGASNICWSTSANSGSTWTNGCLPGITKHENSANPYDRVSDPVVAYDAKHNVWLISTLPILEVGGVRGAGVLTSRSTDGGLTWGAPVLVNQSNLGNPDKNWIVCDNTATSPFYGNCYTEWDDNGDGNRIYMSTSTDGGLTWGPRLKTANNATGIGGQPVVQPNGTVIVPIDNANETALLAFNSTNGGASWSATTTITTISSHTVAGSLRSGPLPSAEVDAAGKVYVVWQDCRFRRGCKSNDLVMTTSTNGTTWSSVTRIPIDATGSSVDHFIPGLAVDNTTSGSTAKLALTYYYYPKANCTSSTCQLNVGYVSSVNGGGAWSAPTQLVGPMSLRLAAEYYARTDGRGLYLDLLCGRYGTSGLCVSQCAEWHNLQPVHVLDGKRLVLWRGRHHRWYRSAGARRGFRSCCGSGAHHPSLRLRVVPFRV